MTRAIVVTAVLVGLAGCAPGGWGSSAGGSVGVGGVGGFYAGSLVVDGRSFGAALNVRGAGRNRLDGVFSTSSPIEIEGDASAAVIDDLLRLTVEYRTPDGCDGRIEGILDVTRGGDALDGPVTLKDCEAPVAGSLTLRRRETTRRGG